MSDYSYEDSCDIQHDIAMYLAGSLGYEWENDEFDKMVDELMERKECLPTHCIMIKTPFVRGGIKFDFDVVPFEEVMTQ
jgi:hypothetical protein